MPLTEQRSAPIPPACRRCGSATDETTGACGYTECGLTAVWLHRVRALACATCGERYVVIDDRKQLHRRIAGQLVAKATPLVAEEIRFLRAHLGLSNRQFADILGVSTGTASRWASGRPIAATADRLLRLLVAMRDRHDGPVFTQLAAISRAADGPLVMRLTRASDSWTEDLAPVLAATTASIE